MLSLLWLFYFDVVSTTSLRFPTHLSRFIISCSIIIDVCNYRSCTSTYVLVCFINGFYWLVFLPSILVLSVNPTSISRLTEVWMSHLTCSFLIDSCLDVWRVIASHAYSLTEALPDTPASWWKCWWTRLLFDGILFSWWIYEYFLHLPVLTCLTWRSDVFVELLLFCILF